MKQYVAEITDDGSVISPSNNGTLLRYNQKILFHIRCRRRILQAGFFVPSAPMRKEYSITLRGRQYFSLNKLPIAL